MKKLSIVTYNMRCPSQDDGKNYFPYRVPLILDAINRHAPDVIGIQESTDLTRSALKQLNDYTFVGCGRNNDYRGEGVSFLYRTDRFDLAEMNLRWLSDTPRKAGSRYEGIDQSHCPRVLLTALLVPVDTDQSPFRIYNLHTDHAGETARLQASRDLIALIEKDLMEAPLPFLVMGDLNATPDAPEITLLSEHPAMTDVTTDLKITFHNWHSPDFAGSKIDYIFASKDFSHEKTVLWTDTKDGIYLSDHHPVEATLLL